MHLLIVIIRLMLSVKLSPKAITLSGAHCIFFCWTNVIAFWLDPGKYLWKI